MDPLSVTLSIVNITTAALQSAQFLAKTIDDVREAPSIIKDISADLWAVEPVLQNLKKALQGGSPEIVLVDQVEYAVENCERACMAFQLQIKCWTRYSIEENTFWIDRWRIGLFGQEKVKAFRGQLSGYKTILSVALSTATMYLAPHT